MAIAYFPILSPQQANPFGYGLAQGAQIGNSLLDAQTKAIQNTLLGAQVPYASDIAQQNLLKQQLTNALSQNTLNYAPQMSQSDIALKQAQAPYIQSQTELNKAMLPYIGYKAMAPLISANAQLAKAGIANQNSYQKLFAIPGFQELLQSRPDLAAALIKSADNSANLINSGIGFNGMPGLSTPLPGNSANYPVLPMPGNANQQTQQNQQLTSDQINTLRQLVKPGVPSQIAAVQQGTSDAYQNKTVPKNILSQRYYDQSVQNLLAQVQPVMPQIAQFAGLVGKSGQAADKFAQATGMATSPQYRNYRAFVDTQMPLIANEMRRSFGGQATDSERTQMNDIANPVKWDKDPQQVLKEFNSLQQALQANAAALSQSPSQNLNSIKQGLSKPITTPNAQQPQPIQMSKILNGVTYHKINGRWYAQ